MKFSLFVILSFLAISTSFAANTFKGKFPLDNSSYELTFSYELPNNQKAVERKVSIFDNVVIPETNEVFPAFCYFNMKFSAIIRVEIKDLKTEEIVYVKSGTEQFIASSYGGLVQDNKCNGEFSTGTETTSALLRVTETSFFLKEKSYRYFLDTNLSIKINASQDNVIVESSRPAKGSDGVRDGEVWIDTTPTQDGSFNRTWFPLSL